jgi:hypothetical protein
MASETHRVNARAEFAEIERILRGFAGNIISCQKMFKIGSDMSGIRSVLPSDSNTAVSIEIFDPASGASFLKADDKYGKLTIGHVHIREATFLNTDATGNSVFMSKIEVAAGTEKNSFRPSTIGIPLVVNAQDKFQGCEVDQGIIAQVCTSFGGTLDATGKCVQSGGASTGDGVAFVTDGTDHCGGKAIFCLGGVGGTGRMIGGLVVRDKDLLHFRELVPRFCAIDSNGRQSTV